MNRVVAFAYECVPRNNDITDKWQRPFEILKQWRYFEVGARVDEGIVNNLPTTALETTCA